MSLHRFFSTVFLASDIPGMRKFRSLVLLSSFLNFALLKPGTCWSHNGHCKVGHCTGHGRSPARAGNWAVASSLIVSSFFPPINSIFSHAWHFLFKKANHEVKSHPQDVNYWHLACQASSGQMPGIPRARQKKKHEKMLCVILSYRDPKRVNVWCDDWFFVSPRASTTRVEGRRPPVWGHRSCHNPKGQRKG